MRLGISTARWSNPTPARESSCRRGRNHGVPPPTSRPPCSPGCAEIGRSGTGRAGSDGSVRSVGVATLAGRRLRRGRDGRGELGAEAVPERRGVDLLELHLAGQHLVLPGGVLGFVL